MVCALSEDNAPRDGQVDCIAHGPFTFFYVEGHDCPGPVDGARAMTEATREQATRAMLLERRIREEIDLDS